MDPAQYARTISDLAAKREPFAVAAVVRTEGSTLGRPGFKMVISMEGRVVHGTLGGACPDGPIVEVAKQTMESGVPRVVRVHLENAAKAIAHIVESDNPDEIYVETNCGGVMEIYVEPYVPPARLILVCQGGRDEIEDHLVHLGKRLGYHVTVIDPTPHLEETPDELIDEVNYDLSLFPFHKSDAVVVLTRGERDVAVLRSLSKPKPGYVGMLASRARANQDLEDLRKSGVPESFLESVHTPIGLDLGGRLPAEIALAILAEIVAARNGRTIKRTGG